MSNNADEDAVRRGGNLQEQLARWLNETVNANSQPSSSSYLNLPNGNSIRLPYDWANDDYFNVLSKDFSGMTILDEQVLDAKRRENSLVDSYPYSYSQINYALDAAHAYKISQQTGNSYQQQQQRTFNNMNTPRSPRGVSGAQGLVPDLKWTFPSSEKGHFFGTQGDSLHSHVNNNGYGQGQMQKSPPFASPYYFYDRYVGSQTRSYGMDVKTPGMFSQTMQPELGLNPNAPSSCCFPSARETVQRELPQSLSPRRTRRNHLPYNCDNSYIMQERDMNRFGDSGCNSMWGGISYSSRGPQCNVVGGAAPQFIPRVPVTASHVNSSTLASEVPHPLLLNFDSSAQLQGYMYYMAKDQNGCRSLQRMVDEGNSEDVQLVFNGVIDNVVELMIDPFGNYLVQKLLDVCREDQRLQIVLMLTKEQGQLVNTSLNSHGTRVVQKLIGTLTSRQQISLVRSAIQPGFLDLIKDLNGNHVIQRCLQCLNPQDNEFIFDTAAKFCVEIATHQHGCCVLQRCIDHSVGKYQDKLVKEICRHGFLLAQDPYGNYVVQYIIELENPSAINKLLSQFKGNYVNLSMQKFSSHVVEKCLKHVAESRSRIVHELLSVPHFEQLLQDPYANYVVQSALAVTKGSLHASLVEAVRPHKILRTSPYCKNIFSKDLLKK